MESLLYFGLGNAVAATVLAVAAATVSRLCRRPALIHCLWLLVLLKLLTPPFLTVPIPSLAGTDSRPAEAKKASRAEGPVWFIPAALPPAGHALTLPHGEGTSVSMVSSAGELPGPAAASDTELADLEMGLLMLWLLGSLLWWTLAGVRVVRFYRMLRYARPAPETIQARAHCLAERLGLARCPGVCLIDAAVSPLLWALVGAPRVLVPADLWDRLTLAQRDSLLTHELAHLHRRDHWVRRLELLVLGLYWWHPVAWWARHELQAAEEQCCDACVVRCLPSAASAYVETLVATAAFLSQPRPALPLGASGIGDFPLLKRRLIMIVNGESRALARSSWYSVLSLGILLVFLLPTWGRSSPPDPDPTVQADRAERAAPVYEHFYAGGFKSLRGFEFRGISQDLDGLTLGGDFMFLNSLEYQIPIKANDQIYFETFVDSGTVEERLEIKDYRVQAGFGIRITVPMLGPVPIALDFGFPIVKEPADTQSIYNFWLGFFR
jgi:beta-lactamase regulating signal transducer with metallopeptidase domain